MIVWREGRVTEVIAEWDGAVECLVALAHAADATDATDAADAADASDPNEAASGSATCRALAYPRLVGRPEPGDLVLLNTTALDRGLGTGGLALVVALPGRLPALDESERRGPGHLVKGRYTPLQAMVLGVDEQESPHHEALRDADDLHGLPVVVADLHSSVPAIIAGLRAEQPQVRVAYVMTDGGALPVWFSRTVARLRAAGWLAACVSVGQAFGGDLEAVTVHTGLLAARHVVRADVAVVAQGPGNLGSGTRWGFSGVAAGEAVNAAAILRGRPVAALRVSGADPRQRHRGISHHSLTAFGRVALRAADVAVPRFEGHLAALGALVREQAATLAAPPAPHRLIDVALDGLDDALRTCPVPLSTMGRGLDDDPAAFLAGAAAGRLAAALLR